MNSSPRPATVKWFDSRVEKRFGTLTLPDGSELWFHFGDHAAPTPGLFETRFGNYDHDRYEPIGTPDPQAGDRVVFLLDRRDEDSDETWQKANPWAFQAEWEVAEAVTTANLADPLVQALQSAGMNDNAGLIVVDKIDREVYEGGPSCKHRVGSWEGWFLTDGATLHKRDATCVVSDANHYHIGCPEKAAIKLVQGGTYLVVGCNSSPIDSRFNAASVTAVLITPAADRALVAKWVTTRNNYDRVVALEVRLGLRCADCGVSGHTADSHAAEKAARAAADLADRAAIAAAPVIVIFGENYRRVAYDRMSYPGKMALIAGDQSAFIEVYHGGRSVLPPVHLQEPPEVLLADSSSQRMLLVVDTTSKDRWYYHASWGKWRRFPNNKLAKSASAFGH